MSKERLNRTFALAFECLRHKINSGRITVDNEASLQLQFAAILKSVGELFEIHRDEFFSIELEKPVELPDSTFGKSGSRKAKIDIFCSFTKASTREVHSCAIEMKYFKKKNHREPNNRYDVFADIHNLENYGAFADCCFMVVATDHDHYVSQTSYSPDTCDFDFRHGRTYIAGTVATYRTPDPYGKPIELTGNYAFEWNAEAGGIHFMQLAVEPLR
jgi:hypothetical protein